MQLTTQSHAAFDSSLAAFGTSAFAGVVKRELHANITLLPLEQAVSQGGVVDTGELDFTVLKVEDTNKRIQVRVGVFFREVVGGCSCGDEPYSDNGYCEVRLVIDRRTARGECELLSDSR